MAKLINCVVNEDLTQLLHINQTATKTGEITVQYDSDLFTNGLDQEAYYDMVDGFPVAKEASEVKDVDFQTRKEDKIATNKAECRAHIYAKYPLEKQLSAAQSVYPAEECDAIRLFIANCKVEEDRVSDLLDAATDDIELDNVESPSWPEA